MGNVGCVYPFFDHKILFIPECFIILLTSDFKDLCVQPFFNVKMLSLQRCSWVLLRKIVYLEKIRRYWGYSLHNLEEKNTTIILGQ